MNSRRFIGKLGMAIILAMFLSTIASATTHCVNPDSGGGCFTTIQAAINAAVNGDTIKIMPYSLGYRENININKYLIILGNGGPFEVNIIPENGNAITFLVGSNNSVISNLTIQSRFGNGIYCDQALTFYVRNCIIHHCTNGIQIGQDRTNACVTNSIIAFCMYAGFYSTDGSCMLFNNIIAWNHVYGIVGHYNGSNYFHEYNCVYGNRTNYGSYFAPGPGEIQQDPQFVDTISCDFHLMSGSPCINAGEPGSYDCDGTRNDMGVYGGPYAWCEPGPVVTSLQLIPATVVRGETFTIQATGATR